MTGSPTHALRLLVSLALLAVGCDSAPQPSAEQLPQGSTSDAKTTVAKPGLKPAPSFLTTNPFSDLSLCRVERNGLFLDLGSDATLGLPAYALSSRRGLFADTWQGQSHLRFERRDAIVDFWLSEPIEKPRVILRAQAGSVSRLTVSLDGRHFGTAKTRANDFATHTLSSTRSLLRAGHHRLKLRWRGRPRGIEPTYGSVRWVEIQSSSQGVDPSRPPQNEALLGDVQLGANARRSLILRSPSTIACPVQVAAQSELRLDLGLWGEGSASATISALRDNQPPQVLGEYPVRGGTQQEFRPVRIDLSQLGPAPLHLQLAVRQHSGSGAVAFGEPEIRRTVTSKPVPAARLVLVVVLGGTHRDLLPPTARHGLPNLQGLLNESVRYTGYRIPTTFSAGTVATLLTGLPPSAHGLFRRRVRLPERVITLPEQLQAASGVSAFFTGVPQTRSDFGLDQGWNQYEAYSPVADIAASQPITAVQQFLLEEPSHRTADKTTLAVIHLRGGHPPWDLSPHEVADLASSDYTGLIDPRRGGTTLAAIRNRSGASARQLAPEDWARLRLLQARALAKQDQALGHLLERLKDAKRWQSAMILVTGDVGTQDPPQAPFGDGRALKESRLNVPLWIKFPGTQPSHGPVNTPVDTEAVSQTIARALRLSPATASTPTNLYSLAHDASTPWVEPLYAFREASYATKWGSWLLSGDSPQTPMLCDLHVDPVCANNWLERMPLLTDALWKLTHRAFRPAQQIRRNLLLQAELTPDTAAALTVWGD